MSNINLKFKIKCNETKFGEELYITGNTKELGNWNSNNSKKLMSDSKKFPIWESNQISFNSNSNLEYKYIIKSSNNVKWENFNGNRELNFSKLENNNFYLINDGKFNEKTEPKINKINEEEKNVKKEENNKKHKNNNNNFQYINTNADEYVKNRRDEIKKQEVNVEYKEDLNSIDEKIKEFINLLITKNEEKKTWREKLSLVCDLVNDNNDNNQIISLIAAYLYFINSGQIKCNEDGTHFRPNHSSQHAFNIFKKLYKQIFSNSEEMNENSFSIIAHSILRNLPSFNEQFMVSVPLTRIRDIAHRSDIPRDLKQEIKHKLQNKLHRNASPDDLIVCEYFINKIKNADYSEAFKQEFYIFYEELKGFFNSNNLDNLLNKFKEISEENLNKTQEIINVLNSNDLIKKIEVITNFRENVCIKIIKNEILNEDDKIQKTLLQTTSNLDIELENKLFVIISEYIYNLTKNININKFEKNYFKNLLNLFNFCLKNIEISQISKMQIENLRLDFEYFNNINNKKENLNRFEMLQMKSIVERGNNISLEICSNLEHYFDLNNLIFLGNKLSINKKSVLVFVESFIRSNIIFQFSKCCDLLMTIIRDNLNLPPFNIINMGKVEGEFYYYENIDSFNKANLDESNEKILFIENSDGTEEIPKNVVGILLNQDLSQLSHISIRVRQSGAAFCCVLEPKIFKNYVNSFKNKDFVAFECLNESKINVKKTEKKEKKEKNEKNEEKNEEKKLNVEESNEIDENVLIYSMKDENIKNTGSKFEKIKKLYEISEKSKLFQTPFSMCIPNDIYKYYFNLFIEKNSDKLNKLEQTDLKNLELESENFKNDFINFIISLHKENDSKLNSILTSISNNFSSIKTNNNLLAIRSSSNLEDNSNQAGAGLFDSYLNIDLKNQEEIIEKIAKVWASVFNSRAIINRRKLNIETKLAKMAVIIMQMTEPDFCYVIHTMNPINGNSNEVYLELAVGLGETLAQSNQKGAPFRLIYNRSEDSLNVINLSSYNYEIEKKSNKCKIVEYRNENLMKNEEFLIDVGKKLGKIGVFIENEISEEKVGQDIEGNFMINEDEGNFFIVQTRPEIIKN
jgi:phosphoglucan,water dikinase